MQFVLCRFVQKLNPIEQHQLTADSMLIASGAVERAESKWQIVPLRVDAAEHASKHEPGVLGPL